MFSQKIYKLCFNSNGSYHMGEWIIVSLFKTDVLGIKRKILDSSKKNEKIVTK